MDEKLLERYASTHDHEDGYYENKELSHDGLATLCLMKDRTNALLDRRCQAAREVIDLIALRLGIDPEDCGLYLYAPDYDGSSPLVKKMDEYFSRSGDKVKLKKRIDELETENSVLRSLLSK